MFLKTHLKSKICICESVLKVRNMKHRLHVYLGHSLPQFKSLYLYLQSYIFFMF